MAATMPTYRIKNSVSPFADGDYQADDVASALNMYAEEMGYLGYSDMCHEVDMRAWRRKPITLAEALAYYVQSDAGDESEKQAAARCGGKLTRRLLRT